MRTEYVMLFLVVGAGVYLTRLAPMLVAMRREEASGDEVESAAEPGGWLRFVGPSIIAALLVTSVLPQPEEEMWTELSRAALALVPTIFVAVRFRNLGLTVLAGVCCYWAISTLM